jgi:polygalacturonase
MTVTISPGSVRDQETEIVGPAINKAIETVAGTKGGGTVLVAPGDYLVHSIRLRSNVTLRLEDGARLIAANPPVYATDTGGYDLPEPNRWGHYQDFGHSHWHNSMIWGEDLEDVTIEGPGLLWGRGLPNGDFEQGRPDAMRRGVANKLIALKNCKRVSLDGLSMLSGGHACVLATGVEDFQIRNISIDTNRDGINLDCCRNGTIEECRVNSPNDDGICLKSSLALGKPIPTENITIKRCYLTGVHKIGTFFTNNPTRISEDEEHANITERTGRIKLGTESNGGFRNITITNNTFFSCRGIALETVDGGTVEDIRVIGLEMFQVRSAPLYIRLGARLRGPVGPAPGEVKGIVIRDVMAEQDYTAMPAIISGIPGYRIKDVKITNFLMRTKGGGPRDMAEVIPPEDPRGYPDPESFGMDLPAHGLFARHIDSLTLENFQAQCINRDYRPIYWLHDIAMVRIMNYGAMPEDLIRSGSVGSLHIDSPLPE